MRRSCSAYRIPNFRLHRGSLLRLVWVLREPILSKTVFLIRGPIVRLRAEDPTLQTGVDSHSGHPGAQGRLGKDFLQGCGPSLGTGPGGCLRKGGGLPASLWASRSPGFIRIISCLLPGPPSSTTHLAVGLWEGSVGRGHPGVGAGSRTLPEPNLFINAQRFHRLRP